MRLQFAHMCIRGGEGTVCDLLYAASGYSMYGSWDITSVLGGNKERERGIRCYQLTLQSGTRRQSNIGI